MKSKKENFFSTYLPGLKVTLIAIVYLFSIFPIIIILALTGVWTKFPITIPLTFILYFALFPFAIDRKNPKRGYKVMFTTVAIGIVLVLIGTLFQSNKTYTSHQLKVALSYPKNWTLISQDLSIMLSPESITQDTKLDDIYGKLTFIEINVDKQTVLEEGSVANAEELVNKMNGKSIGILPLVPGPPKIMSTSVNDYKLLPGMIEITSVYSGTREFWYLKGDTLYKVLVGQPNNSKEELGNQLKQVMESLKFD